jgi:hypothetical protein
MKFSPNLNNADIVQEVSQMLTPPHLPLIRQYERRKGEEGWGYEGIKK